MVSIGIDLVDIDRCRHWAFKSKKQLSRLFSEQEIEYCLSIPTKSSERFAARFAAKEALYKALSPLSLKIPFLTLCKQSEIVYNPTPQFQVAQAIFASYPYKIHVSISHSQKTAAAVVIIESYISAASAVNS